MALFHPASFAQQLCALWGITPMLKDHPAPSVEQLVQVFEIAFSASMATEEGRSVRFGLILMKSDEVEKEFGVARFRETRPLSVTEIRRLAPATKPSSTFIAIECSDDGPRIWGTVDAGSNWTDFIGGESSSGTMLPFNLVITVGAPGSMSIRFSDFLLYNAEHGQVARHSSNVLKFGPIHEFFRPVLRQLVREALPGVEEESDVGDHLLISYGGEYLRFLVRTLRYAEELAHGGTVVILRDEGGARIANHAAIKYETVGLELWKDLVQCLRLTYAEIESTKAIDGPDKIEPESLDAWRAVSRDLREVRQRLIDLSRFLSRLTQVDGALVVTDQFRVLGFGAVIKNLSNVPLVVRSCVNERGDRFVEERSEFYGTRHRSAMTLCREMDSVIFVLSQDGGVKALKFVEGNALLWPSVSLDPSSWFVTPEDVIPELRERYLSRTL
jgi:hypothetical protein